MWSKKPGSVDLFHVHHSGVEFPRGTFEKHKKPPDSSEHRKGRIRKAILEIEVKIVYHIGYRTTK